MTAKFALIVFSMSLFAILDTYAESPIDFSTSDNLKAVYDAGFRPWRDGMSTCNLDHVKVTVLLPENGQFSLPAQIAGFSVLAGDQLSRAEFYSEVMPTDEAVAKTMEICNALGISTVGLDHAVPNFADRFSKPSRWGGKTKKGGVSVQVLLNLLFLIDHIEAKVYVILDWKRDGAPMKFLTSPVQPPPGYENASMEPPKVNPNQKGYPQHDSSYYEHLLDQKKAEMGNAPNPLAPSPPSSQAPPQAQPARPPGISFWIYGGIILSLGLIGALWYRSRPKN